MKPLTIQRYLQAHLCTAVATLLVAVTFLGVDQVQHLFEPAPWALLADSPKILACFLAIVGLFGLYAVALWWVVPPNSPAPPDDPPIAPGFSGRIAHWLDVWRRWSSAKFNIVQQNMAGRQGWFALALLVAAAVLLFVDWHAPHLPIIGTQVSRAAFCWLGVCWAIWLLLNPRPREATYIGQMLFRVLIAFTFFNLLGETLWSLSLREVISVRNYSLWAMLHVSFCLLMLGRITDHWAQLSLLPLRPALLIGLVLFAGSHSSEIVGQSVDWKLFDSTEDPDDPALALPAHWGPWKADDEQDRWLQHLAARLDGLDPDEPVILVAASGGGSRAALFTSLVFEQLRRWELRDDDDDPETPAILVDAPVDPAAAASHRLADQVLLISSVSGGTFASTEYLGRVLSEGRTGFPDIPRPRTCFEEEVRFRMNERVDEIRETFRVFETPDALARHPYGPRGPEFIEQAQTVCHAADPLWFHRSEFVDHVSTDFMAPLLRGILLPAQERGAAVQSYWRDQLHLPHCQLRHSNLDSHNLPIEERRRVPLLVANVTEVDRGSALLVGFPPIPPYFFGGRYAKFHAFPCRALTNLDPDDQEMPRVELTEAARLSANFPWGFSSAQLAQRPDVEPTHLIDGGVFDNTGISTMRFLFERLHDWSEAAQLARAAGEKPAPSYQLADDLMTSLRKRGVILIEIDSGAKQEPPSGIAKTLPGIFEPVTALENVSYTSADRIALEHLRRLKKIFDGPGIETTLERWEREVGPEPLRVIRHDFGSKLEDGNITMFHAMRITCNHETNIMTSWALSPNDKAKVFVQFLIERPKAAEWLAHLIDVQARSAVLLDLFQRSEDDPQRLATTELIPIYEDLLWFNRETERELRKADLVQQRAFARLRQGDKGESLVAGATPEAPNAAPRSVTILAAAEPSPPDSPQPEVPFGSPPNRTPSRATSSAPKADEMQTEDAPLWRKYRSSPSSKLRQMMNRK
ncbi:MAG: hypothetical protein U0939_19945 [Pirellulales bacterium]